MLKILRRASIIAAIAPAVLIPLAAQAADPEFCRGYAQAAINQVRGALNNPNCARGLQGARWSADFKVHFDWCLTAAPGAAETERIARTEYLRGCRG